MALIKIYTRPEKHDLLVHNVANEIKLIAGAVLNVPEVPTTPESIEVVYGEGIDLIGIDYIIEIIAVERPSQQQIANNFIDGLKQAYPDILFSVYFNNISEVGMANTPRPSRDSRPITMQQALEKIKGAQ